MRKIVILIILCIAGISVYAQYDPEAKRILDQFSKKNKAFSAIKIDYTVLTENKQNGENTSKKGSFVMKGEKYKMDMNNTEIYYDGKTMWNYLKDANEVNITKPNFKKNSKEEIMNNPSKLFNIYATDFKYQYKGDVTDQNQNCFEVDLYPKDLNNSYAYIRLHINKQSYELVSAKIVEKSGIHITVQVNKFTGNFQATDKDFTFDTKSHPKVEVIDLRK